MARGKKKESALTPEEKLEQALVPGWEQPYKVPKNWCWSRLGSIVVNHDAKRVPLSTAQRSKLNKIYDYYGASGVIDKVDNYIFDEELLLIGEDGANLLSRSTDIAFLANGKYWVNNHAHVLDAKEITTNQFLCNYINHIDLSPFVTGSAQPKLTQEKLNSIPIPLPPNSEQQRIVERIEYLFAKLEEAKEKAQSVLDSFETRKAAILYKAFTGELTAKWRAEHGIDVSGWNRRKIGEFADVKGGKRLPKGHALTTEKTNHPYLRIADFGEGTIDQSDLHYITEETYTEISRYIITADDVYVSIVGTIGKAGIIPKELSGANLTENAARIITQKTLPQYLCAYLSSPMTQDNIHGRIRSATLGKLSLLNIKDITVPIPTKEEQSKIVCILDILFAKEQQAKEAAEAVLEKIDLLKKSILARAFRGELGTNDPTEESAIKLLKTII